MSILTVILICLLLSAFFSGMEIAFVASNKLRIEISKSDKSIAQALIDLFVSNSGMYITTMLVGNNVVMVIYGIFMKDYLVGQFGFFKRSFFGDEDVGGDLDIYFDHTVFCRIFA